MLEDIVLNDLDMVEELRNVATTYHLGYGTIDSYKARINYKNMCIEFNPAFNEECVSFMHESLHHIYDKVLGIERSEKEVETQAQEMYKVRTYRKLVNELLGEYLK